MKIDHSGPAKRFNRAKWRKEPFLVKVVTEFFGLYQTLKILIPTLIGVALFGPLGVVVGLLAAWGMYTPLPADPITCGTMAILNYRIPINLFGFTFVIPGLESIIKTNVQEIDEDLDFVGIACRLESGTSVEDTTLGGVAHMLRRINDLPRPRFGGQVKVVIQVGVQPHKENPYAIRTIIDRGGIAGARGFLKDMIGEDVRQAGRALTAEEYMFATDILNVALYVDLTGKDRAQNSDGSFQDPVLSNPTESGIRDYLEWARTNGHADIKGAGFTIKVINVKTVVGIGKFGDELDRVAIEVVKSAQLERNLAALRAGIDALKRGGDNSITDLEALVAAQLEDDKGARNVDRKVNELRASPEVLAAFVEAARAFAGRSGDRRSTRRS